MDRKRLEFYESLVGSSAPMWEHQQDTDFADEDELDLCVGAEKLSIIKCEFCGWWVGPDEWKLEDEDSECICNECREDNADV